MSMSKLETAYLICWVTALCVSIGFVVARPSRFEISTSTYWKFLFEPWKILTFIAAAFLITIVAPYSGDPTWDYPDSIVISCLTFTLAPWSVGVMYQSLKNKRFDSRLFVAICFFFTPCWFYDGYILFRDHMYPPTWSPNLVLSGGIVLLAGMFWNLAWRPGRGGCFAFTVTPWPDTQPALIQALVIPALIIAIPVLLMVLWFVYDAQWAK